MCGRIKTVTEQIEPAMGKKPIESYVDVIPEQDGRMECGVEEEILCVKVEIQ